MKQLSATLPAFDAMLLPTIQALQVLGGSGTTEEIDQLVAQILNLADDSSDASHVAIRREIEYRLAWSRAYLKKYGLLQNSTQGVWSLVSTYINLNDVDATEIIAAVLETEHHKFAQIGAEDACSTSAETIGELAWHQKLHQVLLSLQPATFERLMQRVLRESGFVQVQITRKTGDGSLEGLGIVRISGFLSFSVLFECQRNCTAISAEHIRGFRAAMEGRCDRGLLMTTGTFTQEAMQDAIDEGTPPIDLIDGRRLINRLKELGLGVKVSLVESVEVDTDWFTQI
jgi:restriction system protein